MDKKGRPTGSKYKIGDLTPTGNLIIDISSRPKRFNKKRQKFEGDGNDFKIRCSVCNDPQNDRWTNKVSEVYRCKPCYTKTQKIERNTDSTYKVLFATVKSGARKRGYKFNITLDEFKAIVIKKCYWCGEDAPLKNPQSYKMPTLPAPAHGIDRLDNSVGYVYDNCVASCRVCNVAKNNSSIEEFRLWIKKIYKYQFQEVISA